MEYCIQKEKEVHYFYERLEELQRKGNLVEFTYNLSAFLTAVRSITAYTRDKARKRDQQSIENLTKSDGKVFFLKNQRNITIHVSKLKMTAITDVSVDTEVTVAFQEDIKIEMIKGDELEEIQMAADTELVLLNIDLEESDKSLNITHQFYLKEWDGDENILELSSYYLT